MSNPEGGFTNRIRSMSSEEWRERIRKVRNQEVEIPQTCAKTMQRKLWFLADWFDEHIGSAMWRRPEYSGEDREFEEATQAMDVRIEYLEEQQAKLARWIEKNAPELANEDTPANIVLELLDFYIADPEERARRDRIYAENLKRFYDE